MAKKIALPGEIIKSKLSEYLVSASGMARDSGINGSTVRLLITGKARITVAIAFRLAKYFKTPAEYWLKLQEEYDIFLAKNDAKLQKAIKAVVPVKKPTKAQLSAAKAKEEIEKKSKKKAGIKPKAGAKKASADKSKAIKASGVAAKQAEQPKAKRGRKPKATPPLLPNAPESSVAAPQEVIIPKKDDTPVKAAKEPRRPRKARVSKVSKEASEEEPKKELGTILIKKNGGGDRNVSPGSQQLFEDDNSDGILSSPEGNSGSGGGGWLR
jgi:addiction module HigA family antidote